MDALQLTALLDLPALAPRELERAMVADRRVASRLVGFALGSGIVACLLLARPHDPPPAPSPAPAVAAVAVAAEHPAPRVEPAPAAPATPRRAPRAASAAAPAAAAGAQAEPALPLDALADLARAYAPPRAAPRRQGPAAVLASFAPQQTPSRRPQLPVAFERAVGRPLATAEARTLTGEGAADRVAWLLAQESFYAAWWEGELAALGLVGTRRPLGETWDSVPRALLEGRLTATEALGRALRSPEWRRAAWGPERFGRALLALVPGEPSADDWAASRLLFAGSTATFLGHEGRSAEDAVAIAVADARFGLAALARAFERLHGRPLAVTDTAFDPGARLRDDPNAFFEIVAEWSGA